ncbi:MAG: nickel pincer cofactor biosynthesis protein LarB [Planctomycetales bacterium]|nr:nickel pincer cofactor biosynthesis protein LarB [Planctomycetales bacterium]
MGTGDARRIVERLRRGAITVPEALAALRDGAVGNLGFARVDHDRARRCGFPEVILCEGKTPREVGRIAGEILRRSPRLLATRADAAAISAIRRVAPGAAVNERARTVSVGRPPRRSGRVAIVTAGTADVPVAEEARVTAEMMGARVEALYDVGVAGIHRVLARADLLRRARVLVVAAGMEGALPSVVAGLVSAPVIAVPTSGGYGATFGGLAALLAMVNSCAPNVACVGIDDGFGAGYFAALVNGAGRRD